MKIDRAAVPFVTIAAMPLVVSLWFVPPWVSVALGLLPIAIALFFRDPERSPPSDRDVVLSPADGKVMHAGPARAGEAPPGLWKQVTVFLSVLDVHINRTPVAGRVTRAEYLPGSFRPAYRHDSHANERSEIWIDHEGTNIVVRQVVGLLARRVVCRVSPGQVLAPGERIGLMKFGSRMDVFLPETATIVVTAGESVRGGLSVIAKLGRSGR